jgi:EAL domain-containing protein (putative c-di-GMP-specific phosphodiesterase class I)
MSRIRPAIIKIDRDALLDIYGERIFTYVTSQALSTSGHTEVIVEGLDDDSKFSLAELYKQDIRYVQGHALGQPNESIYTLSPETQENICRQLDKVWKVDSAK